ncbi:MAG TPA: hypothetical protein VKP11_08990 [Frankiaceae bacterium]|nr:hypothetical protein [Frankiaceae bacterium]
MRLSVTLPPDVERSVRAAAEQAGVPLSQWIARVAEHAARVQDGLRAVAEHEAESGPIPAESDRRARAALARVGLLDDPLPAVGGLAGGR